MGHIIGTILIGLLCVLAVIGLIALYFVAAVFQDEMNNNNSNL